MVMPTLSFTISQAKFDKLSNALAAYNAQNPNEPLADENAFAEVALRSFAQIYLTHYREQRIATVKDQLATCSEAIWNQVTGLLG